MNDILNYSEDTSHLHIRFYEMTQKNERKSREAGRAVHDKIDMVEIRIAGDKKTIIHAPADSPSKNIPEIGYISYKQRFPKHWEVYERTQSNLEDGTPLAELTSIDAARRADLKSLNIHTVESLATLSDTNVKKLGMDGSELRDIAKAFLSRAAGNAVETMLIAENAEIKTQMSALEAELARLKAQQEPKRETLSMPKDKAA
jgi:uncharacterized small protein (DUF1192 family)